MGSPMGPMSQRGGPMGANPTMGAPQPPMMLNPAFQQWAQMAQAWMAEKQRREDQFRQACELLKEDASTSYKIDIEADSTIAADQEAEKAARTEFLRAITPFMETILPQMVQNPALAPLGKELMMFAVRGFSISRGLEDAFETALDQLMKAPPPPPQQHGNTKSPAEVAAEAQTEQTKAQVDMKEIAADMMKTQVEAALKTQELQQDQQQHAADFALRQRELAGREALQAARMSHMAARDTQGLV